MCLFILVTCQYRKQKEAVISRGANKYRQVEMTVLKEQVLDIC